MNKLATLASILCLATFAAFAADAPQFRGPASDGIFQDKGLLQAWPEGGPALAWKAEGIGTGYASASVANGTVYIPGMNAENMGILYAFDEAGKPKWNSL